MPASATQHWQQAKKNDPVVGFAGMTVCGFIVPFKTLKSPYYFGKNLLGTPYEIP
jgi:hypothetical protein